MKCTFITLMILTVFAMTNAPAQFDRSVQPTSGPPPSIKLPGVQRVTLDNGLSLLLVEHHELPVVQLQLVIKTGAAADPIGLAGIANLTADLIDEGTTTRTALQLADEIDFIGAELNTSASFDGSLINLQTLKEHLGKGMELLADVVQNPSMPESEFDRLKQETLTDLLQQKDRPDMVSTNIFFTKVYGSKHPYGFQASGSEETVNGITLAAVKEYYASYYVPNNATLVAVGDLTKEELVSLARKSFGSWKKNEITQPAMGMPAGREGTTIYIVDKPNAPQSQIRIGNSGVPRNTQDYFAVSLLNQILGSSNGRLFLNLREAKGYTYGAYSQFIMRRSAGPFMAYAGVRTDVTDSAVTEFMKEINRLRDEIVPEEEFSMYKAAMIQRLPRIFETPGQISGQLGSVVLYNLPDTYFDGLVDGYNGVTREEVQRVAKKYLQPGKVSIVIVGDKEKIAPKLEKLNLGAIVVCDDKGNEVK